MTFTDWPSEERYTVRFVDFFRNFSCYYNSCHFIIESAQELNSVKVEKDAMCRSMLQVICWLLLFYFIYVIQL